MPNTIKSVQIVGIDESKFVFHKEEFDQIINNNPSIADLPVCVIIINGAFGTGKSFLSNLIIRSFITKEDEDIDQDYLIDYFSSRRGTRVHTMGIWALNKIFVYEGKAIILMDTQGIFDHELTHAMSVALITLSTLISSYQIYNLDKRIQEDQLENIADFSSKCQQLYVRDGKALCILVRDWQNFEDNNDIDQCIYETEQYKNNFIINTSGSKKATRDKIYKSYDVVDIMLLPHPGYLVTENKFSGKLSDIRNDFIHHVDNFIKNMYASIKSISPKQTVEGFTNHIDNCIKMIDIESDDKKIKECKQSHENIRTKILKYYKDLMGDKISTEMSQFEINQLHHNCLEEALNLFNSMNIMGNNTSIQELYTHILKEIDDIYNVILIDLPKLSPKNNKHVNTFNISIVNKYSSSPFIVIALFLLQIIYLIYVYL